MEPTETHTFEAPRKRSKYKRPAGERHLIELGHSSWATAQSIKAATDVASASDVVKRALKLYHRLVVHESSGGKVKLAGASGEVETLSLLV
jgi:hypothetical protein